MAKEKEGVPACGTYNIERSYKAIARPLRKRVWCVRDINSNNK